jgi:hypothetical protein
VYDETTNIQDHRTEQNCKQSWLREPAHYYTVSHPYTLSLTGQLTKVALSGKFQTLFTSQVAWPDVLCMVRVISDHPRAAGVPP